MLNHSSALLKGQAQGDAMRFPNLITYSQLAHCFNGIFHEKKEITRIRFLSLINDLRLFFYSGGTTGILLRRASLKKEIVNSSQSQKNPKTKETE